MTDRVHVAVAIVVRNGRGATPWILIGHRLPNVHLPDYWEFPGGKLEPGETSAECARREVSEETAVQVQVLGLLLQQEHDYPDRKLRIDFHVCRYQSGVPGPRECQAVRWVPLDRLDVYPFPNANDEILAALRSGSWIVRSVPNGPGSGGPGG